MRSGENLPGGDAGSEAALDASWPASATVWSTVSPMDWLKSEVCVMSARRVRSARISRSTEDWRASTETFRRGLSAEPELDNMRWFSHLRRNGGRHNCITYLRAPEDRSRKNAALFRFFCPRWPWLLNFDLDIRTRTHLTAKFCRPTFNRSKVIVLTSKR